MNIALDISPISSTKESQHKVRGVGFYVQNLKGSLVKYFPNNKYIFIEDLSDYPQSADILHIPYFDPFFVHLPKFKKAPFIVTIHDLTPVVFQEHFPVGIKGNLKWQAQKFLVKKADAIITDSESSKKDIISILGFDPVKVHVVYLAADKVFRKEPLNQVQKNEILKKYSLPQKFMLYVGDVTWNKNLPRLIKAVAKTYIPLVMVGKALTSENYDKTNIWNHDLHMLNTELNNIKNIYKIGFVPTEDLVKLYNLASCFVFPSLYEGFGLPVLEAMQCGCPVVTTKNGSLQEIAGDSCLYINGEDENDIIKGIQKVFTSNELQKQLSLKGLQQAKNYSWEKTARETVAVYKKVYETTHQPDIQ